MSPSSSHRCVICDKPDATYCSRCKGASYCSKKCQTEDWPVHKLLCADFAAFTTSDRPSDEHFRAIIFPVDKTKPKLVWLHCKWHYGSEEDDGPTFRDQFPDAESLVGPGVLMAQTPLSFNSILRRKLRKPIAINYGDNFLLDGSRPNMSILATSLSQPGHFYCAWRGQVTAYGMKGNEHNGQRCRDMDMADFRHLVDHFLTGNCYSLSDVGDAQTPGVVRGVRINCSADRRLSNKPQFEAVDVPVTDPIFSSDRDTSDIAMLMGMPIYTRRLPPNPEWCKEDNGESSTSQSPTDNEAAAALHLCCDPEAEPNPSMGELGLGFIPQQWQSNVGSVLVVRQDKKPLLPEHGLALAQHCIAVMYAFQGREYPNDTPLKTTVIAKLSRRAFVTRWCKLVHEHGLAVHSPYLYETST